MVELHNINQGFSFGRFLKALIRKWRWSRIEKTLLGRGMKKRRGLR